MSIGTDRVQVVKRESASLGGNATDDVDYNAPISPQTDAIESAGIYLQDGSNRDANVYIARNGQSMVFRDQKNTVEVSVSDIVTSFRKNFLLMGA